MKYLKGYIFYPMVYNDITSNKIKKALDKYNTRLNKIKGKYDYELLKLYNETPHFHDYRIISLDYTSNEDSKSKVSLVVRSHDGNEKYNLVFEGIEELNIKGKISDLEDIVLCEIDVIRAIYYIGFHCVNCSELQIRFKKVICTKID